MDAREVIASYHALWQVEASFRMSKTDLRARPMFHHKRESIEAHLTIVFAALAIARHLQEVTDVSIKKLVATLRPLRHITINIAGQPITGPQDPCRGSETTRPRGTLNLCKSGETLKNSAARDGGQPSSTIRRASRSRCLGVSAALA